MHPRIFAQSRTNHPALILSTTGETATYGELEAHANQGAHLLRSLGLIVLFFSILLLRTERLSVYKEDSRHSTE